MTDISRNDMRSDFFNALAVELQALRPGTLHCKAVKAGIKLSEPGSKRAVAEIYFEHLRNADGVYVGARVFDGAVHRALSRIAAGEKSSLFEPATMSFNSLSERFKEFSNDQGGAIRFFAGMDVTAHCKDAVERVQRFHLRKLENFVTLAPGLVNDVLGYPDHYAFPTHTIALCL